MPLDRSREINKKNEVQHSGENKRKMARLHGKKIHGQLLRNVDGKLVDIEQSNRWLKSGDIKGETESTIMVAQDQAISTKLF